MIVLALSIAQNECLSTKSISKQCDDISLVVNNFNDDIIDLVLWVLCIKSAVFCICHFID